MDLHQECVFILIISLALLFLSSPHQSCLLPIPRSFPFNLISITHRVRKLNSLHHTLPTFTLHYLICTVSCSTPLDFTLLSVNQDRSAWTTGSAPQTSLVTFKWAQLTFLQFFSFKSECFLFHRKGAYPHNLPSNILLCYAENSWAAPHFTCFLQYYRNVYLPFQTQTFSITWKFINFVYKMQKRFEINR